MDNLLWLILAFIVGWGWIISLSSEIDGIRWRIALARMLQIYGTLIMIGIPPKFCFFIDFWIYFWGIIYAMIFLIGMASIAFVMVHSIAYISQKKFNDVIAFILQKKIFPGE